MIHPTAIVSEDAELGEGVEVGPFAVVESGARIGAGTRIGPHAVIHESVRMGERNIVRAGAVLGGDPQSVGFDREGTFVRIGEGNMVGEYVTIHRATAPGGATMIGDGCYLMSYSHIGHDCFLGDGVVLTNYAGLAGHVELHDRVLLGAYAGVHQFCRVGTLAMLSAGSRLGKDVAPYIIVQGYPAVPVATNVVGMRRAGIPSERRDAVKKLFKIFFRRGLTTERAIEAARKDVPPCEEKDRFLEFLSGTERGLCK